MVFEILVVSTGVGLKKYIEEWVVLDLFEFELSGLNSISETEAQVDPSSDIDLCHGFSFMFY